MLALNEKLMKNKANMMCSDYEYSMALNMVKKSI
jgi:hypothetical protein